MGGGGGLVGENSCPNSYHKTERKSLGNSILPKNLKKTS
ncbi:Hypothetical protein LEPBI_I3180 [Leptospira biflexa serovar Patoc strain 'Patoc 1 (Paris)']|uniref:Uncharacterized protein n=1 Tax=Leptospira biflexa serovar Patoc (strain Patoc 1 / ATCC 23582 / Paris) TaxID=456481 RepID=B0SQ93_LEPBP|nr:Hypothetical protein LEPBI_I3180 [Leptospira biflexa serovar Patoc strain 'Patoc 1 (Paris)']